VIPVAGDSFESLRARRSDLIADVLEKAEGKRPDIIAMTLAAGGNSRETWIFTVAESGGQRAMVFRCDPDHWIREEEMKTEIAGLTLANRAGVPAPQLLYSSAMINVGRPFVITSVVGGTTIPKRVIREDAFAPARQSFAADCGRILAALHTAVEFSAGWQTIDPVADLEGHRAKVGFRSPVLEGALSWLVRNRPSPIPLRPAHRDFRLGNLMISETGIVAVLDWETCGLSDPHEDLAWLCSRAWRYGGGNPVGGIGTLHDLIESYEYHSGQKIDPVRLHWWRVLAATRWGFASAARPRGSAGGAAIEEAAIARQVCRQEYNVLLELKDSGGATA
jgi:aminoglycoside phosphotransferase (APT) family kinase protein